MKESFGEQLKAYGAAIRESFKNLSKEGKEQSAAVKERLTVEAAKVTHTDVQAEQAIYGIQKSKIEKLNKFKKFLEKTRGEHGAFIHPEQQVHLPRIVMDTEGNFLAVAPDGGEQAITLGEIMTDHEWGIDYAFDQSVDIHDIRAQALEKLKRELRDKLDEQIVLSETANTYGEEYKKQAYRKLGERINTESEQQGVVAEKMVKNFLKKLSIDTDADFEIIDADAYQDVEQKIDFIIHRTHHTRGARVAESESAADIGVQFTINTAKGADKERQINASKRHLNGIDDLVLVTIPAHDASMLYKKWKETKASGGPEKAWDAQTKERIFRGVMDSILTPEEVDEFCDAHFS